MSVPSDRPSIDALLDATDMRLWKAWARHLHAIGKRRAFGVLEPIVRELLPRVRDAEHTAHDVTRSLTPSARVPLITAALDELRAGTSTVVAEQIATAPRDYVHGVTGVTWEVLGSAVALIRAMVAPRAFEQELVACIFRIGRTDRGLARQVCSSLAEPVVRPVD